MVIPMQTQHKGATFRCTTDLKTLTVFDQSFCQHKSSFQPIENSTFSFSCEQFQNENPMQQSMCLDVKMNSAKTNWVSMRFSVLSQKVKNNKETGTVKAKITASLTSF